MIKYTVALTTFFIFSISLNAGKLESYNILNLAPGPLTVLIISTKNLDPDQRQTVETLEKSIIKEEIVGKHESCDIHCDENQELVLQFKTIKNTYKQLSSGAYEYVHVQQVGYLLKKETDQYAIEQPTGQ